MRVLLFWLFCSSIVYANNDVEKLFNEASALYEQNAYADALSTYKEIERTGQYSSNLYFNIANCHFKMQQNAKAVLYYEKVLKISPNDEDALFNLKLVQLQLVDKLAEVPQLFYQRWLSSIKNLFSIDQWAKLGLVFVFLFVLSFIIFLFSKAYRLKKNLFSFSAITFLLSIIFLGFAYYSEDTLKKEAILMEPNAYIKSAPSSQSEDLFILHEGTKIQILEVFNDWTKIKLSDGMIGWLESKAMEEI